MQKIYSKLPILCCTLVLSMLFITASYVRIESPHSKIIYKKPKVAFSIDRCDTRPVCTYASFFLPTSNEISTQGNIHTTQYDAVDTKQLPDIELFTREAIGHFSNMVDFKYITPIDWINIAIDITEKNDEMYKFSQNLKLTHKYHVCNILTGDNAFVSTQDRIIKTQEELLTTLTADTITNNSMNLSNFTTNEESNSLLIQTEENIFNHNRQLTINE